jgi:predicted regulator of Ras-like GTPase activity (Roadblock/LC7/MglB family)
MTMNLVDILNQVLEIKGVTSAAVVSGEGFIVEGVTSREVDLGFVGGLIASSLASSQVLAGLLGEGEVNQMMIEYENGPVLFTPLKTDTPDDGSFVAVVTLDSTNTLGRARFQLRKLLPEIGRAINA